MKILSTLLFSNKNSRINLLKKVILVALITLNASILLGAVPPPGVTKVPNVGSVCRGSALSVSLTGIPVSGCTCNYEQEYMLPGAGSWSPMTVGATIIPNAVGTTQIRARINCTGPGCGISDWTVVSWNIVDFPTAPTSITRFPDSDLCVGATATAVASGSTGGTGSCYYLYSLWHDGDVPGAYSTTNSKVSDTTSTLYAKAVYYCDGYGCNSSNYFSTLWNIALDPLAPKLVKEPNLDSVCIGASVSVNFSSNTGGTGNCTDLFRSSDNGGTTWSSWATTVPVVNVTNAGQIVIIQGKKECDGPGCNAADTSMVSWKGINDPVWGPISLSEDSLCAGGIVSMSASTVGGSGGNIVWHRYHFTPSFSTSQVTSPNTVTTSKTYYYYPQYNASPSNSGCNLDTGVNKKLVVVSDPSWIVTSLLVTPKNDCLGAAVLLNVNLSGGIGSPSIGWIRDTLSSFTTPVNVLNGDIPPFANTYYYRAHYNPSPNPRGCNLSDGAIKTVNIFPLPIAQTIIGTPVAGTTVCLEGFVSATFSGGTNSIGSEEDEYEFSTNGGVTWSDYDSGDAFHGVTVGTDIIQIRTRKVPSDPFGSSGASCKSDWRTSKWSVSPSLVAPTINVKTPNNATVCRGTSVNATINAGSGGVGCSDIIEFSINNGISWNSYTSGQLINTNTATKVIIRVWRGNCDASSGCVASDANTAIWDIQELLVNPILTKNPALANICQGKNVSATIQTPGNGGVGCTDILEYRINSGSGFGSWLSYSVGNNLPTVGLTGIEIRGFIGNCLDGSQCPPADTAIYSWTVSTNPVAPIISRVPDLDTVCRGAAISAIIIAGTGGTSCTDTYQQRTYDGSAWSIWSPYTAGSNILYGANIKQVEVRGFRGGCSALSGCLNTDFVTVNWVISEQPINPVLTASPNIESVCNGQLVSAALTTPGSGGSGCTDAFDYRTFNGTIWSGWLTYTPGMQITTTGITKVQIIAYRKNCNLASLCNPAAADTVSWIVTPQPTDPTITKNPNQTGVCFGTPISGTVIPGTGGSGCTNFAQYRMFNGATWTTWSDYTSADNIVYGATITKVEVRAYRGDCAAGAGCISSNTALVSWNIHTQPVAPILTKAPNTIGVCEGTAVNATLTSAGSGGIGCSDVYQYRTNNGTIWSAWHPYNPTNLIGTAGLTQVEIQSYRGNCLSSTCSQTVPVVLNWEVYTQPHPPLLTKIPNSNNICGGTLISATATPGSGGSGCYDEYQYRTFDGSTWGAWLAYTPGNTINPTGFRVVEIRGLRTCPPASGCFAIETSVVNWSILENVISPVLSKDPNVLYVCEGTDVSASLVSIGSGGPGCTDGFKYTTDSYVSWTTYTPGNSISTIGLTEVTIIANRRGCGDGIVCGQPGHLYTWFIVPPIVAPTLTKTPDLTNLCQGASLKAIVNPGSGGLSCGDVALFRTNNGTVWSSWAPYVSNTTISSVGISILEIKTYRGNCSANSLCIASDTNYATWNIFPQPIAPIFIKVPDAVGVCAGTSVSAVLLTPGTGGVGCTDNSEYRSHNGTSWSAWLAYTPGAAIATTGLTQVEIRSWRGDCSLVGCISTDMTTFHWTINASATKPLITRTPNQNLVCHGTLISATITGGTGGSSCNDVSEYRTLIASVWSPWNAYISTNTINSTGIDSVEIRTYRVCPPITGCSSTDTNLVAWKIAETIVMPLLSKVPNTDTICEMTMIGANMVTLGSGGAGCSNVYEISINGGTTWNAYIPGNMINSAGLTDVRIRYTRTGCPDAALCGSLPTEFKWIIVSQPIAPIIVQSPIIAGVCEGTPTFASITPGFGGVGCTDKYESRTNNGISWSVWTPYSSNSVINSVGIDSIQIRVYRGNCNSLSGCFATDTTTVSWVIYPQPIAPILTGTPSVSAICEGTNVSAAIVSLGSGGDGCEDVIKYRTNSGSGFGPWAPYSAPTIISTIGLTNIQIISYRGNCDAGSMCVQTAVDTLKWIIVPQVNNPIILRTPDIDTLCSSNPVFATITPATGGVACTNYSQVRIKVGTMWTGWSNYVSGNTIPHGTTVSEIEIRAFRGDCLANSGCLTSDTSSIHWVFIPDPIAPVLQKNPNFDTVCVGINVNASLITAGSDGSECSDLINYRTNNGSGYGAWATYIPSTNISTIGLIGVQIVSQRGNCNPSANCVETTADTITWMVSAGATTPTIIKTPNTDTICNSTPISAAITNGTGGSGCTDFRQYRSFNGTSWTAWTGYTNNSIIPYTSTSTEVQIRAFRGDCEPLAGCVTSDTATVSWIIVPQPTNPILTKVPNVVSVCDGTLVSAIVNTSGTGGSGCTDIFEYRTNNGIWSIWQTYIPGATINSAGITTIQIISQRGNCNPLSLCVPPPADTLTWTVVAPPIPPTVIRVPDHNICNGDAISAIITPGSGGLGCSETYQYRIFDGATWTSWLPYTSGNNIAYSATATQAEVRVFRANCDPASGCDIADTNSVNWLIPIPIIAPVMAKEPNIEGVCDGTPVYATLTSAGSGGLNCTDTYEYRINDGSGFGAWIVYVPATIIPTTGLTEVEIRYGRDICDPLNSCVPPTPVVLNWFVAPQPIGPSVVRNPNVDSLCAGPEISGTITPGSGGAGCVDIYEYRVLDTLGIWTAWLPYPSDSILQTNILRGAQIRVSRTNCFPESGCAEPLPVQVEWKIFPQPIPPVLTRTPNLNAVCESTLLSADFFGDAGGVPPTTIIYQYENPSEWIWNSGNSFTPNANGMAYIRAKATSDGYGCLDSEWEWVSWIVDPKPVITAPADQTICENGSAEITAVVVGGYGAVNYSWEMSTTSCAGPWSVIADSTRSTLVTGPLSTTTWYRLVATQQATSCLDVSSCIAINIKPAPTVTISGENIVCFGGTSLTATVTNQPNPVVFQWQYSNLASGPWANTGTNSNVFNIPSVEGSHYYRCIVTGDTIGCTATSIATLVQLGTIPTITHQSSDTSICNGQNIFLHVVADAIPTPTYQWFGPSGLIVGETSDTLFVNNTQLTDDGIYYCNVMSTCDTVSSQNMQVNVLQNLVAATAITGTTNRCQGVGFNLYTHNALEVLTNNWSITPPEAGTIDATGLVSWNTNFAGTAQITVNTVGCDITSQISLNVIVDTMVTLPTISGTIARCQGVGTDQYMVVSPGATSFVWSISNAGISTINPTTGLVDWDSTFAGISTIFVYANGCGGPSTLAEYAVTSIDSVVFTQSGNQNWCVNDSNALWVSPVPTIGNSFQWYNGNGEIAGATNAELVFNPIQELDQGAYYCKIITLCGDTLTSIPDTISVHPLPHVDFLIAGACRLDSINFINLSTIINGTISYQWNFDDGMTSTSMDPSHIYLVADTFNVMLAATSSWGCSKMFSQTLIIHELPQATAATISDSCNHSGRGSIITTPTFGTPPFSYLINGGESQLDSVFSSLLAGNYLVTIVDSNNCRTTIPAVVTEPNILKTHIYPNNILCYNDSSGIANLEVTGGTEPYQFVWSNGQTSKDLFSVPIGTYDVAIVDANGCFAVDTVALIQPNPLIVDSLVIQTSCLQVNDGKIFVFVSGGTGIYDYLWATGEMVDSLVNLSPNIYQITITDGNGCKSIHDYEITINNNECLTIWTSFSPDGDGTNDVWNIGRIGLYPNNVVQIFNRWGAQLFESKGYSQPWDGTWNNKPLPAETYYYVINLGDGSSSITGTVTIIR